MAQRVEHHPLDAAFAALLANGLDGAGDSSPHYSPSTMRSG